MYQVRDVDHGKPIYLTASKIAVSHEAAIVALAQQHGDDGLRRVSAPVKPEMELTRGDAQMLLAFLHSAQEWHADFDLRLQWNGDGSGRGAVLAVSIPMLRYERLVSAMLHPKSAGYDVALKLVAMLAMWRQAGAESVRFSASPKIGAARPAANDGGTKAA